jgi:hypothetical protein
VAGFFILKFFISLLISTIILVSSRVQIQRRDLINRSIEILGATVETNAAQRPAA